MLEGQGLRWDRALVALLVLLVLLTGLGTSALQVNADTTSPLGVTYPGGITTDYQRLECCYSLLGQLTTEHNRQGAIARADWKTYEGKWQQYTSIYRRKADDLLTEIAILREAIRQYTYTEAEWAKLSIDQKAEAEANMYPDKAEGVLESTTATYDGYGELTAVSLDSLNGQWVDPPEDLTTYTSSGSGHTTNTSRDQITDAQTRNQDLYLHDDKGAAPLDALDIDFTIEYQDGDWNYAIWGGPGLSNTAATDFSGYATTDLQVAFREGASYLELHLYRGPGTADDYISSATGGPFYCTLTRAAGNNTAYCYVYSDAARTAQVTGSPNTTAGFSTTTWRYFYADNCYNDGASGNRRMTAYIENIDLNEGGATPDISNTPATYSFGVVNASSTYYAAGSAPSNPVEDGDCTFTITNSSGAAVDLTIEADNWTGGDGWTLTGSSPGSGQVRMIAYYSGQNPASGVTLTTSPQSFYSSLADSSTLKWDFSLETGGFTDGVIKDTTITLTASLS